MNVVEKKGALNLFLHFFIAGPLIWLQLVFVLTADVSLELYHRIAFPIYGIEKVKRSEYIRIFDRTKLPYLRLYEKIYCAYCGYVNGWLHYASEIAARSEKYFCAIRHLEDRGYRPPEHEKAFSTYGESAEK